MHFGTPVVPDEIHDEERVVERQLGEADVARRIGIDEVRQHDRVGQRRQIGRFSRVRKHDDTLDGLQLRQELGDAGQGIVRLAVVVVAVGA